ncbi:monocarboxylate transporter 13-like isoform X2 [Anneissia japonica]|uniref:monocarboxylate transporter 13-like isoform X2 n=1 Tax=Anneissia japonica TaxID=1529436 RepID=UPI00142562A5|nr:monocarboxylate transporter 13-like isoform X2 [Anneissia japonica]
MENVHLPHSNLSNTDKLLCLLNNGFLYFMLGVTNVIMGVLNAAIADSIGCTDGYITFIAAISMAVYSFTGFMGENLLKHIGLKYLTIVSTLLRLFSTCMLSTINDAVSFAVWMTVLGLANGLIISTSISVLGSIFVDHLSNAIGFVTLVYMVGTATPPVTQVWLENYGWRGALLVTGALHLHGLVTATALDSSIGRKQDITYTEIGKNQEDKTFLGKIGKSLQLSVFKNMTLNALFFVSGCIWFVIVVFHLSLIPYAISISIEPLQASFLKTLVGMGCVIVRIVQCIVPQTVNISTKLLVLTLFIDVVALTFFIFSNQYTSLALSSFIHGAAYGLQSCLIHFLAIKSVDTAHAGGAIAWCKAFAGIGNLLAGLLGFFNSDKDLLFCFQISTALQAFALIPSLYVLFLWHCSSKNKDT